MIIRILQTESRAELKVQLVKLLMQKDHISIYKHAFLIILTSIKIIMLTLLRGGLKSFEFLQGGVKKIKCDFKGGSKKFRPKNFYKPSPPTKVFMNTP